MFKFNSNTKLYAGDELPMRIRLDNQSSTQVQYINVYLCARGIRYKTSETTVGDIWKGVKYSKKSSNIPDGMEYYKDRLGTYELKDKVNFPLDANRLFEDEFTFKIPDFTQQTIAPVPGNYSREWQVVVECVLPKTHKNAKAVISVIILTRH